MKTKIALLTAEDVSATRVHVDTVNGRVTLHGKVESAAEKARAAEVAKKIEGVREVRNLLQVVPDKDRKATKFEDAAVRERVDQALRADGTLSDSQIRVKSVDKGVVLLSGSASTLSAHLRAVEDAHRIPGVRRVVSEVQSPDMVADREIWQDEAAARAPESTDKNLKQSMSDMWITTAAKVRLMADSTTPALDINVDTDDGVVTLFGVVPSEEAKKAAEADVRKVSGVKDVENALEVVPKSRQEVVEVRDDAAEKTAKEALKNRDEFKNVSVEVKNGTARLTGTVANSADRLMAAVAVRSSNGIRSVDNDLQIKHD